MTSLEFCSDSTIDCISLSMAFTTSSAIIITVTNSGSVTHVWQSHRNGKHFVLMVIEGGCVLDSTVNFHRILQAIGILSSMFEPRFRLLGLWTHKHHVPGLLVCVHTNQKRTNGVNIFYGWKYLMICEQVIYLSKIYQKWIVFQFLKKLN